MNTHVLDDLGNGIKTKMVVKYEQIQAPCQVLFSTLRK